jgi:tetratricopeptide (TPR) repeat protein
MQAVYGTRPSLTEKAGIQESTEELPLDCAGTCIARDGPFLVPAERSLNNLRRLRRVAIVDRGPMPLRALVVVMALTAFAPSAYADARSTAKSQVEFGIKVAQNGLWKEATYRWEKAVELDPTYAAAWNNLAIGYEHEGKFEEARQAYDKAVTLDPKNLLIRQNYDLFKEINDRAKRRSDR